MLLIGNGISRNLWPMWEKPIESHGKKYIGRCGPISISSSVHSVMTFSTYQKWATVNITLEKPNSFKNIPLLSLYINLTVASKSIIYTNSSMVGRVKWVAWIRCIWQRKDVGSLRIKKRRSLKGLTSIS